VTLSADDASAALADIESISRRVKQSSIYRASSLIMIGWGALVALGNLTALVAGRWTGWCWVAINFAGAILTIALIVRMRDAIVGPVRAATAFALFFAFGFAWSALIGKFGPREASAFWPMLFMFGYALQGLFLGRAFTWIGVGLAALILIGYEAVSSGYDLYLAVVNGGGLMLCGYWMRRA